MADSLSATSIWLADDYVDFLVLDTDTCVCVCVFVFRWSVMTYEVPTTNKHTPIVKEDDSPDSPLQVNWSAERSGSCLLFDRWYPQISSHKAGSHKLRDLFWKTSTEKQLSQAAGSQNNQT